MRKLSPFLLAFLFILLASCGPRLTPTPTVPPTLSAAPSLSPTVSPTASQTPRPTRRVTPSLTFTPVDADIVSPTPTASTIPTQTPVPATPAAFESTPIPSSIAPISAQTAKNVVELARWGGGSVNSLAYSRDGTLFAANTPLGTYLYDADTLSQIRFLPTVARVDVSRFSFEGAWIALGLANGRIEVYDVESGDLVESYQSNLTSLSGDPVGIDDIIFAPNRATLYTIENQIQPALSSDAFTLRGVQTQLTAWDLSTGATIWSREIDSYRAPAFASGGRAIGVYDMKAHPETPITFQVLDLADMSVLHEVDLKKIFSRDPYTGWVQLSPGGDRMIYVDGTYAALYAFDFQRPTVLQQAMPLTQPDPPESCPSDIPEQFEPEPYVEPTDEFGCYYCDTETPTPIPTATGTPYPIPAWVVNSAAFSPDGKTLALGRKPGTVDLYSLPGGVKFRAFHAGIRQIDFSSDGARLLTLSQDETVALYNLDGSSSGAVTGVTGVFNSLAVSPDGNLVAAAADDGYVRAWNLPGGTRAFTQHYDANDVAFSPDGKTLAAGLKDGSLVIWPVDTKQGAITGKGRTFDNLHLGAIDRVIYSPDGTKLTTSAEDCILTTLYTGSYTTAFKKDKLTTEQAASMRYLVSSPDGTLLAGYPSAKFGNVFVVMVAGTRDEIIEFPFQPQEKFRVAAFSPDNNLLAAVNYSRVLVWDLVTRRVRFSVPGGGDSIAFSPDNSVLAVGLSNGNIRLLNPTTGQTLSEIPGHRGAISRLQFTPGGSFLLSASADGTVRVWGVH